MPSEAHIRSGAEAIVDIQEGMLKAAGEALKRHGNDPNTPAILSAAFCMAVEKINENIDPTFRLRLIAQLVAGR